MIPTPKCHAHPHIKATALNLRGKPLCEICVPGEAKAYGWGTLRYIGEPPSDVEIETRLANTIADDERSQGVIDALRLGDIGRTVRRLALLAHCGRYQLRVKVIDL